MKELKSKPSIMEILQTVGIVVTAVAVLFLLGSLLRYEPSDRVNVLAEATQQAVVDIQTTLSSEPVEITDGEQLTSDKACLLVNTDIQGTYYEEYQIGFLVTGDTIQRTGRTYLGYTEVNVGQDTNVSRFTNTCWIKE